MPDASATPNLAALMTEWARVTHTAIGVTVTAGPEFELVYVNDAFEKVTGYSADELIGAPVTVLHGPDTPVSVTEPMYRDLREGRPTQARLLSYRRDGTTWWNDLRITPVGDTGGAQTYFVGVAHDVTDEVAAERQSAHAATHDGLTGLANRAHFAQQLDREIARAHRDQRSLAVLFLDIDRLKAINDGHGHAAGDALLAETARRLRKRLRGQDLAARHGGDEFVVLLVDLPDDGVTAAAHVVDDLTHALGEGLHTGGRTHQISVSAGISLYPRDATTADALIAAADAAMYAAKAHRRDTPKP